MTDLNQALVGIIMGSQSDWATLTHAANTLSELAVPYEKKIISAQINSKNFSEISRS